MNKKENNFQFIKGMNFNFSLFHSSFLICIVFKKNPIVVTLALASRLRHIFARLQAKNEAGSHITWSRECKECEGMNPHTPKWTPIVGIGVPNGLANFQSAIAKVKTHRFEEFFISLKKYWNVDV
jgi:hypothetical protein